MYDDVEALGLSVVALSQEDESLDRYGSFLSRFGDGPRFPITADLGRRATPRYDRVSAYLVDRERRVRQIFPMVIHTRPSWESILAEAERVLAAD